MPSKPRTLLLLSVAACSLLMATDARANDAEKARIKQMEGEIQALQATVAKLVAAQAAPLAASHPSARSADSSVVTSESEASTTAKPATAKAANTQDTILKKAGAKLTLGGFMDAGSIFRSKNQDADFISNYNASIPFNNSVNGHQSEFRGSARATRLSLLAEGSPDESTNLIGYVEADFLGAASTANSIETNGFTPRMRQGFVGYERQDLGVDVYAGQMWSLTTLGQHGLSPRHEAVPPTIDAALVPGFTYIRTTELRLVKEWDDNKIATAISVDSPQVNFGGIATPGTVTATSTATASSFSNNNSTDVAPDLIAKVAYDPGYGHYEAFGLGRFFHDNTNATFHNNIVTGVAGGFGAVLPVIDKVLSFQLNGMIGSGIGRYGPALLPDFAFSPNGSIKPLNEYMGSVGLIGHPTPTWDAYLMAGAEKVQRDNQASATYGYGDLSLKNAGCYVENGACPAQTSSVWQVTAGIWHDIYKGDFGDMKIGIQDSETRRNAFSDSKGLGPHSYENIVMTSFRYYPF